MDQKLWCFSDDWWDAVNFIISMKMVKMIQLIRCLEMHGDT